jgi:hypothetical protein
LAAEVRHDSRVHLIAPFPSLIHCSAVRRAALVVEGHDALGRPRQISHDEPDARIKLAGVPLDLGHDTPEKLYA